MKLRNKKTGEIVILIDHIFDNYKTLAELNKDWEDYEGPKEYWYIDCYGMIIRTLYNGNEWDERRKLIGNYFETKEEAEKAVEKLKAFKRLKDKGFRFDGWNRDENYWSDYTIGAEDYITCDDKDLDLLFGGEE